MADQESQGASAPTGEQAPQKHSKAFSTPLLLRPIDMFRARHEKSVADGLTFYQRNFTRPVSTPQLSKSSCSPADTSGQGSATSSSASSSEQKEAARNDETSQATDTVTTPEAPDEQPRRKFSVLSRGFLVSFILAVIVILAILIPVLATQLAKRDIHDQDVADGFEAGSTSGQRRPDHPSSPKSPDDPLGFSRSKPPMRLALLANFPDPSIHFDVKTSTWYAFATNEAAGVLHEGSFNPIEAAEQPRANVQVATSTDFVTWTVLESDPDALPTVGAWVRQSKPGASRVHGPKQDRFNQSDASLLERADVAPGLHIGDSDIIMANVWAPDVISHPNKDLFLLYYSAITATKSKNHHCIGAATATSLVGPYDPAATAIACPEAGAIDPVGIVDADDNNTIYVAYKVDGNSIGHGGECNNMVEPQVGTPIMLQRMAADGISVDPAFAPVQLLDRIEVDGPLIEAPSLVHVGKIWYLFYSSGCTRNPSYDVRYATATNITGPYTRHNVPLLRTGDYGLMAPGSVSVRWTGDDVAGGTFSTSAGSAKAESLGSGWKIALHARVRTRTGGVRAMFTAGLAFDEGEAASGGGNVTLVDGIAHG